jgi:hypothetical protein
MSAILSHGLQRRTSRREVLLSCQIVRERDFRLIADLALDLSTEGMLVAAKMPILTGEELIVSFRAPRSDTWIDTHATVARVIHGRRPGDRGRCLGITFHSVPEFTRRRLLHHLRDLPTPEPSRSPCLGTAIC